LPEKSDDDFGQLSMAFNQMADTIVGNMEEMKRTDDLRRELIGNVSHDLRGPLASLQGYLETILIKLDSLSKDEMKRFLEISLDNANNLSSLVSELFELSKLDARQTEPSIEVFSISELAQDVVMKYKPHADEKKISIKADLDGTMPLVKGDIGMIERVLSNLLDNAVRYTPENGTVSIVPEMHDSMVRVKISDTGHGIPEEDIPHIFGRYYRGKRGISKEKQGTGLGLAIAKKMLELHCSDIKVETAEGKGTTFHFELEAVQQNIPAEKA
ncbi:MAG: two-component sensor histidine kinase, partial [candidate division Zixibacteria bacterium]|nr:two-component sensor histidine kinase [candidate division Zixibacteria bacterium]